MQNIGNFFLAWRLKTKELMDFIHVQYPGVERSSYGLIHPRLNTKLLIDEVQGTHLINHNVCKRKVSFLCFGIAFVTERAFDYKKMSP